MADRLQEIIQDIRARYKFRKYQNVDTDSDLIETLADDLRNCYIFNMRLQNIAASLIESLYAELKQTEDERDGLSIMLTNARSTAETHKRERDAAVDMFVRWQSDIPCDEFCGSEYCEECRLISPSAECWTRYLMHSAVTEEE